MLIVTLLFGALVSCNQTESVKTGLEGKQMPSFRLLLADSTTYLDTKDIPEGRPTVLFDFGPHCPYSRSQMTEIIKDMKDLKNINFYVFTSASFNEMKTFYEHYKLNNYSNIIAGIVTSHSFEEYFQVTGVPYLAIYDDDKKLKKSFEGKIYTKQIKKAIDN